MSRFERKIKELRAAGKGAKADAKVKRRGRLKKAVNGIAGIVGAVGGGGIGIVADIIPKFSTDAPVRNLVPLGRTTVESAMTLWESLSALWDIFNDWRDSRKSK
jgi:hypothetical protein